jgi:hypothetical protein
MLSHRPIATRSAALLLAFLAVAPAQAQVGGPPTPPVTLWQFLGIPAGIKKLQGATRNRRGNHPNLEPKPPMRAIADPRNLESEDKAIKKAAEVKQAEDLKAQKIKAVKYLASIGCGCYDVDGGVTEALVASMSDCTEDVRYETINAISEAAENGCCANCGSTCCCNKDILTAMAKIAYERDDHGCYLEPSQRVREAAAEALRICCPNDSPPVIVPAEQPEEQPERESVEPGVDEGDARETDPATPPIPTPPGGEPLPDGAATWQSTPAGMQPYVAPAEAESAAVQGRAGNGFGVVVHVSPAHGLAHVHFNQSAFQASVGSIVGVYEGAGQQRHLLAKLQVVETFPGSANVTGSPDALTRIARGDVVLQATVVNAEQRPEAVAAEPVSVAREPSPREAPAATSAARQATAEMRVVPASSQAPVATRIAPRPRPLVTRRPVSATFMR